MYYLDSSALLKLVFVEAASFELRTFERELDGRVLSSVIAEIEVLRAARRRGDQAESAATQMLSRVGLLPISGNVAARAATLDPPTLRSWDAIHIASALSIRDDLKGLITYDIRMREAAEAHGLTVVSPGG